MGLTKAMLAAKNFWPDNIDTWVGMGTDAIKQSCIRLCVTAFVCRRLPQGMPVSPEDAKSLAKEARSFLKHLFKEIEC